MVRKSYRPVSDLPFLFKFLGKIVLLQLKNHWTNKKTPSYSHSRANHSIEYVLLHTVNDLLLASDFENVSVLTFFGLSAAFNTVGHSILLSRLEHTFGIYGTALSWFMLYLCDRFQTMSINNIKSHPDKLTCSVPQGSDSGPVLFTLSATLLASSINRHSLNHLLYADDSKLLNSA